MGEATLFRCAHCYAWYEYDPNVEGSHTAVCRTCLRAHQSGEVCKRCGGDVHEPRGCAAARLEQLLRQVCQKDVTKATKYWSRALRSEPPEDYNER